MLVTKSLIKQSLTFLFIAFMGANLFGQMVPPNQQQQQPPADYTDQELQRFVQAVSKVMVIQEEGQMQMMAAIEDNDISVDRFNEMLMQGQQQGEENIDATEEEMLAFNNALEQVQTQQMQMQENMMEAITDEGLDVQQYQNIMQSYEVDPELKERVDKYFEEIE